jgi:hypothetical protein
MSENCIQMGLLLQQNYFVKMGVVNMRKYSKQLLVYRFQGTQEILGKLSAFNLAIDQPT